MEQGAGGRPAVCRRSDYRPGGSAAAAAYNGGAGASLHASRASWRPGRKPACPSEPASEARRCPSREVMTTRAGATLRVSAYTIPTDEPEADGTLDWASTTIVVVEADADACTGIGYTYAPAAAGAVVGDLLAGAIRGIELL